MFKYANPTRFMQLSGAVLPWIACAAAVLIAAASRVVLGLGVTQQHQTAHGAISIRYKSAD